jgi:hypothetical protein
MKTRCRSNKKMSFALLTAFLIVLLGGSFYLSGCRPKKNVEYDPSDINQVASAFVKYVRDGNEKGLKDVTLGLSNYGILGRVRVEYFEVMDSKEITLTQSQRDLTLNEYGIPFDKTAIIDLSVKVNKLDHTTGVTLHMGYSSETNRWYVTGVF